MRTMFEDTDHGSEMQMSTLLMNFHEAVLLENRIPEELYLGADNTPKETKKQVWMLVVDVADVYHVDTQFTAAFRLPCFLARRTYSR